MYLLQLKYSPAFCAKRALSILARAFDVGSAPRSGMLRAFTRERREIQQEKQAESLVDENND